MPMGGNTVGVGATATMSIPCCGSVIGWFIVKKGDPATSVTLPPLPMENTETEPGTKNPAPSVVARFATNRNFPAGSITIVLGTTSTFSMVVVPWIMMFCPWLKPTWLPTTVVVPLEFILKARIPVVLLDVLVSQAGLALMIAYAKAPAGSTTRDEGTPFS